MADIYEKKVAQNGKPVLVVAGDRYWSNGEKIEFAGQTYTVTGMGSPFRGSDGRRVRYAYVAGNGGGELESAKSRYGTSERAWAAEDERAWSVLRQAGL